MPRSPFTPAQTRDWQARMRIRLPDEKDLRLARRMDLESDAPREATDYDQTVAGYLGELRRGEARALTWFLDHEKRLAALARVSGCRPEDFRADLAAVEASELGPLDLLWWSGFEDLGPVALGEGFVLPPVYGEQGGRLGELELRKLVADKAEIRVEGAPGSGVSTLLRWLATQSEAMGWRAVRWDGEIGRDEMGPRTGRTRKRQQSVAGALRVIIASPFDGLGASKGDLPCVAHYSTRSHHQSHVQTNLGA